MGNACGLQRLVVVAGSSSGQHSGISSSNPRGWDSHAEQFLQPLGLEIYVQAFQVAGFDSDKQFKGLVAEDLDHVQRLSHIPILPGHRQKILDAARCYKPAGAGTLGQASESVNEPLVADAHFSFPKTARALCRQDDTNRGPCQQVTKSQTTSNASAASAAITSHTVHLFTAGGSQSKLHLQGVVDEEDDDDKDNDQEVGVSGSTEAPATSGNQHPSPQTVLSTGCTSVGGAQQAQTAEPSPSQASTAGSTGPSATSGCAAGPLTVHRSALPSKACQAKQPASPPAVLRHSNAWADLARDVQSTLRSSAITSGNRQPLSVVSILGTSTAALVSGHATEGAMFGHVPQVASLQPPPKPEHHQQPSPQQSVPGLGQPQQHQPRRATTSSGEETSMAAMAAGGLAGMPEVCSNSAGTMQLMQSPRLQLDLPPSVQHLHQTMLKRLQPLHCDTLESSRTACINNSSDISIAVQQQQTHQWCAAAAGCTSPMPAARRSTSRVPAATSMQPGEHQMQGQEQGQVLPAKSGSCGSPAAQQLIASGSCSVGNGARAADVYSIVHQAKERAAAKRQVLGVQVPGTATGTGTRQQASEPEGRSDGGLVESGQQSSSRTRSVIEHEPQQQQLSMVSTRESAASMTAAEWACNKPRHQPTLLFMPQQHAPLPRTSVSTYQAPTQVTTALWNGEKAIQMLQEYRSISELDAINETKATQLSRRVAPGDRRCASTARGHHMFCNVLSRTGPVAGAAAFRQPPGGNAAIKAVDCEQQQQQMTDPSTSPAPSYQAHSADSVVTVLLGIDEALNNSYDYGSSSSSSKRSVVNGRLPVVVGAAAGKACDAPEVQRQHLLAAMPLSSKSFSGSSDIRNGYGCRGSVNTSKKQAPVTQHKIQAMSQAADRDDNNPFLAPATAASTQCSFHKLLSAEAAVGVDNTNPFLRESLVL